VGAASLCYLKEMETCMLTVMSDGFITVWMACVNPTSVTWVGKVSAAPINFVKGLQGSLNRV
jgi:hypothetical protein